MASHGRSTSAARLIRLVVLLIPGAIVGAMATAADSRSVWTGVYTDAQAEAGAAVYAERCESCHGSDLGGMERAPALVGPAFRENWHGKSLRRLLERLESMPPESPKTLPAGEYLAVLAYLLSASEIPSGQIPLPESRTALADITFERAAVSPSRP